MFNRWQEDWSVLADPRVPRQPLDGLKYIPLSSTDPETYLSFGADARARFEYNDAMNFGTGPNRSDAYLLSRTEFHADLRVASQVQFFVQLQSDFAPGKEIQTPVDVNRLDLEQAFVLATKSVGEGTLKLRAGRQQFAFDVERFISSRDGANVRQSFDALWAYYEKGPWQLLTYYSHPVQTRDERVFDDLSSSAFTFSVIRMERQFTADTNAAAFYAHFTRDNVQFLSASGNERRDVLDIHYAGKAGNLDWDMEVMGQTGRIGSSDIEAWAFGAVSGYTFSDLVWKPRVGLQLDIESGDTDPEDDVLGTFNPLFPNGAYLNLANYTGLVNLIHVKPSIRVQPAKSLRLMFAVAPVWRYTTGDAVYAYPLVPIPGTAGEPGGYTGTYGHLRLDWIINRVSAFAIEAVHFQVSDVIRNVGGHNGNYIGVQYAIGW